MVILISDPKRDTEKPSKKFKERIFVFPADPQTNQSIAQHPSLSQEFPDLGSECRFGRNAIILPVYEIENVIFETFKKSKALAFYAFKQTVFRGSKQYFYSQNIKKKTDDKTILEIQRLLEKIESLG